VISNQILNSYPTLHLGRIAKTPLNSWVYLTGQFEYIRWWETTPQPAMGDNSIASDWSKLHSVRMTSIASDWSSTVSHWSMLFNFWLQWASQSQQLQFPAINKPLQTQYSISTGKEYLPAIKTWCKSKEDTQWDRHEQRSKDGDHSTQC